jgi:hypothetical protein
MEPLFSLSKNGRQVDIRDDGEKVRQQRLKILDKIYIWARNENEKMAPEVQYQTPYINHLTPDRVIYYFCVVAAVSRMACVLCAHPEFSENYDLAMKKALQAAYKGASDKTLVKSSGGVFDYISNWADAIREIGKQFDIVLPKNVL